MIERLAATAGGFGPGREVFLHHAGSGRGVVRGVAFVVLVALLCVWVGDRYRSRSGRGS